MNNLFEQRIFGFIGKNKLTAPRGCLILGVSGGADSMALLMALSLLRHDLGVQLHAAHFNHKYRPLAGQDERFVAQWCGRLNVPLTIGHRQGGKIKRLSEDDARQMRFDFFIRTARHLKAQAVALAHTRNDLAETVLMRLMRGSGLYGIRAIMPKRTIEGIVFVRPLLGVSRFDVEAYLKSKKTPYCTDSTNNKLMYVRNKVRLQLLPLLAREYNPKIINALSDLAATAGDDYEYLSTHARRQYEKSVTRSCGKVKLGLKAIKRLHPAIVRLILRQMVETLAKDPAILTFEHIHRLEELTAQNERGAIDLPHHLRAVKTQKYIELFYV